ncbi:MAG: GPP34 family phosphoprotein, partial [Bacteroidota bacterium]|nr:GPP34 family phosphoprotein [Bacteroidota bacterium]
NPGLIKDPILNEAIKIIAYRGKTRKLDYWIIKLSRKSNKWKKLLLKSLIHKHILVEKEKHFLGIIPYKRYPMVNPTYENEIKSGLVKIITEDAQANDEEIMLIGLIHSCDLSSELFKDRHERKIAKKKIKELSTINKYSKIINETQAAINAAIVASIASTAAVSAATTG